MEDDYHYLTVWPTYQEERKSSYWSITWKMNLISDRMLPKEEFVFLINPRSCSRSQRKGWNPKINSKACVWMLQDEKREGRKKKLNDMYMCIYV